MIGPIYVGTDAEAAVLSRLRATGDHPAVIAQEHDFDGGLDAVASLYFRFLGTRVAELTDPDAQTLAQAGLIDRVDALIDRYTPQALAGDITAARFVVSSSRTAAAMRRDAVADLRRRAAMPTPADAAPDADKAMRRVDELHLQYAEMVAYYAERGEEVPSHFREAILGLIRIHTGGQA